MMVTVLLLARGGLLGRGFGAVLGSGRRRAWQLFVRRPAVRSATRAIGSPPNGLSLKRAKPSEGNQEQAEQHGERLRFR